ncbi:hypothetical protein AVEN_269012-1 [Araneus ventricosus]|uniref:Integrase catalytic domain-containing protein n=1 Tax=Araneus ventricosus TaxID=182803 RepID=A0A4Y2PNK8_ARAVE|nr:hypothetical protein AVEN_269012-1 [Araneus ventricosus]
MAPNFGNIGSLSTYHQLQIAEAKVVFQWCVDQGSIASGYQCPKLPEAFPMSDQLAETVAQTLYTGWISRFGVPDIITSDRGSNFKSNPFHALTMFSATSNTRTTSFHPATNGIVERMHRQLKASIKCYTTLNPSEVLPTVLLGMRACLKEDIRVSPAEMAYG